MRRPNSGLTRVRLYHCPSRQQPTWMAQARNPYSRSWLWIPGSRYARPGMTAEEKFSFRFSAILPVQSSLEKYSRSRFNQIKSISLASHPHEGRIAIVTDAGRDAVDAAASGARWGGRAGWRKAREQSPGVLTNDAGCGRQSRVVLTPVAGVKLAEARRPDRVRQNLNPLTTVTRRIRRRGEHEISR
jgi:hypothetical protein